MRAWCVWAACVCVLCALASVRVCGAASLSVELDETNAQYFVVVNGVRWLESSAVTLRVNGQLLSSEAVDPALRLSLSAVQHSTGTHTALGSFEATTLQWQAQGQSEALLETEVRVYNQSGALGFVQRFPQTIATGAADKDVRNAFDVVAAFPSFRAHALAQAPPLNFLTFVNDFFEAHVGAWPADAGAYAGVAGALGGIPFVLYGEQSLDALLLAPIDHLLVSHQVWSSSVGGDYACGLAATVHTVPAHTEHQTLLLLANDANRALMALGDVLLATAPLPKPRTAVYDDLSLRGLGYWTDNGAYYYYTLDGKKTYQQTMDTVFDYLLNQAKLPLSYVQFDSWWYNKEVVPTYLDGVPSQGLVFWEPNSTNFPDGFAHKWPLPLVLHNRFFAANTTYASELGFGGHLIVDEAVDRAAPLHADVFDYLMRRAQEQWQLAVYEQDWLIQTYGMIELRNNLTRAAQWLDAMDAAARGLALPMQLCMCLPQLVLYSTRMPSATVIRYSNDYQPGNLNWAHEWGALLVAAMGAVPFKDVLWSGAQFQSGCHLTLAAGPRRCQEPTPLLEMIVSVLTGGPVGFGDKMGLEDRALVLMATRADGVLLKPDTPAQPFPRVLQWRFAQRDLQHLFHGMSQVPLDPATAAAAAAPIGRTHYVFSGKLAAPFAVTVDDLESDGVLDAANVQDLQYFAYPLNSDRSAPSADQVTLVDATHPLQLQATPASFAGTNISFFEYFVVAPVLPGGWVLLGEYDKVATVAARRFAAVAVQASGPDADAQLLLDVQGGAQEEVHVAVLSPDHAHVVTATCVVPSAGATRIICAQPPAGDVQCTC